MPYVGVALWMSSWVFVWGLFVSLGVPVCIHINVSCVGVWLFGWEYVLHCKMYVYVPHSLSLFSPFPQELMMSVIIGCHSIQYENQRTV